MSWCSSRCVALITCVLSPTKSKSFDQAVPVRFQAADMTKAAPEGAAKVFGLRKQS